MRRKDGSFGVAAIEVIALHMVVEKNQSSHKPFPWFSPSQQPLPIHGKMMQKAAVSRVNAGMRMMHGSFRGAASGSIVLGTLTEKNDSAHARPCRSLSQYFDIAAPNARGSHSDC